MWTRNLPELVAGQSLIIDLDERAVNQLELRAPVAFAIDDVNFSVEVPQIK